VSVEIFDMDKLSEDADKPAKLYKDSVKQSMLNDIHTLRNKGFRFSDIAVLVRNNRDGSDIADYLSKNNIPVMSSDSIMLNSSDKVRLIIYTLRCLQDDKNDVAKLALSFYRNICSDAEPYDVQKALKDCANLDSIYELRYKSYSLYDLCCAIIDNYNFNII
jgi:superfamily I DNA/RNA helicase